MLLDPHVEERSDSNHGDAHGDKTCIHDRLATQFIHKRDGYEGRKHIGYSDDHRSPHFLIRAREPRKAKDRRSKIHHDIDAGKLLTELQPYPKANDAAEVRIGLEHLKSILLNFQVVLDFFNLRSDLDFIKMHCLEHQYGAIFETF